MSAFHHMTENPQHLNVGVVEADKYLPKSIIYNGLSLSCTLVVQGGLAYTEYFDSWKSLNSIFLHKEYE